MNAQTSSNGKPLPVCKCPVCSHVLDSATGVPGQGDARPKPGDLSVCLKCGEVLEFAADMSITVASVASLMALDATGAAMLEKAQRLIRRERYIK